MHFVILLAASDVRPAGVESIESSELVEDIGEAPMGKLLLWGAK